MRHSPLLFILLYFIVAPLNAQEYSSEGNSLFTDTSMLDLSLHGNTKALLRDRKGKSTKFPMELRYTLDNEKISIPVSVKTRGHFRRTMGGCKYPPLRVDFEEGHEASIFAAQEKLKLVVPCRGEDYLIKEWLVYRIYQELTPYSFGSRLVKVKLHHDASGKTTDPFYAILLEEEEQMAHRNQKITIEQNLHPKGIEKEHFFRMALFQYLIANTDWSVQYRQNIKVLANSDKKELIAVPYDFDHAGFVAAPYAKPAEALKLNSVKERRYRGYCSKDWETMEKIIEEFQRKKPHIYALFNDIPLLDAKEKEKIEQFVDDFYASINDVEIFRRDFEYPCDPKGTGKVVIKGLKE